MNETGVWISAISAFISALSAFIATWNYRQGRLNQMMSAAKWKKEYFADLQKWSDESMLLLSEAMHLCELRPDRMKDNGFFDTRHQLRVSLSAQIDRGRWFFPNYATEEHGRHRQGAYRGYRPAVLDGLVHAYNAMTALDYADAAKNTPRRSEVESAKRLFTTEIQKVLDPKTRDAEFASILGQVAVAPKDATVRR